MNILSTIEPMTITAGPEANFDHQAVAEGRRALKKVKDRNLPVLLLDNRRKVIDLGRGSAVWNTFGQATPLLVRECAYFTTLAIHPNLNPILHDAMNEELANGNYQYESREQILTAARPWFRRGDGALQAWGPIGTSALLIAKEGGSTYGLVGRRSSQCAVSVGAWTTSVDEGIFTTREWYRGLIHHSLIDELRITDVESMEIVDGLRPVGLMQPATSEELDHFKQASGLSVVQSGANYLWTFSTDLDNLRRIARQYNDDYQPGLTLEIDDYQVVQLDRLHLLSPDIRVTEPLAALYAFHTAPDAGGKQ